MTIQELLADEALRQHEFPVTRTKTFLGHAAVCALPRRVADTVAECAQAGTQDDQEALMIHRLDQARDLTARLLNCHSEEVALVGPTSLALSFVAAGLNFRKGDNVLVYQDDYPSNVYPWMALAARGVQVRFINTRGLGIIRPVDVMGQVDENTRLVALASCHFISGYRLDHQTIGKFLRERGILFCLDGIQTVGAWPTTVEYVDFLAADAHKWLLGPCAAGIFYVRRELQEKLNPPIYGWHNVHCPGFVTQDQLKLQGDARKFEAGTHNLLGLTGLVAALELLEEVGSEAIATELARKRLWFAEALLDKKWSVLNPRPEVANLSGITTIYQPGTNLTPWHTKLKAAGIQCSLRSDRQGQNYLRFSPHFYNTDTELKRALELL